MAELIPCCRVGNSSCKLLNSRMFSRRIFAKSGLNRRNSLFFPLLAGNSGFQSRPGIHLRRAAKEPTVGSGDARKARITLAPAGIQDAPKIGRCLWV